MMIKRIQCAFFLGITVLGYAQKVGINTNEPTQTLEVKGPLQVQLPNHGEQNSIYESPEAKEKNGTFTANKMVVANANGVIGQHDLPLFSDALHYIEFNIKNVQGDWIESYNTKISTEKYVLLILTSSLTVDGDPEIFLAMDDTLSEELRPNSFSQLNVQAKEQEGEWHIYADYPYSNLVNKHGEEINGNWTFQCLLLNKKQINGSTVIQSNLDGSNTGESQETPISLQKQE